MLIENIFVELRARLRSCNVFITTGISVTKNCNFKISIQSNRILIIYTPNEDIVLKRNNSLSSIESLSDCYSEEDSSITTVIPIDEYCRIIPNSMSGLKIDKNNISFRVLTEPNNGGNFYKEILTNESSVQHKAAKLKINLKANENLKLLCVNCSNTVSDSLIKFDRVLELPTSNIDMADWFCCSHSHGNTVEPTLEILPKKHDFLYRLTYFVINMKDLNEKANKFNTKREIYHCNRCLAWLGLKSKDTVKLYNSTVKINQNDFDGSVFVNDNLSLNLTVNDFVYTIESMTREFNLGYQYAIMCKLVLECTFSLNKKHFLLIWVMDKELQVLQSSGEYIDDIVKLKSSFLSKILYKVEESCNSEVESWLADPSVISTEISKNMFASGLEHLNKMALNVPEAFRHANGYRVTYLNV